jgi:hypothetical protein
MTPRTNAPGGGAEGKTPGQVREVAVPPDALALTTLSRVDYTDAFRLEAGRTHDWTGEEWARAMLQGAPAATRTRLRRGWFALGVRLGSADDERRILGWAIRRSSPEFAVLAASSVIGMEAEVVCKREPRGVLVATFMRLDNPVARMVWAVVSPRHRKVLRHLIEDLSARSTDERGSIGSMRQVA